MADHTLAFADLRKQVATLETDLVLCVGEFGNLYVAVRGLGKRSNVRGFRD
jgi:hypothetical protein